MYLCYASSILLVYLQHPFNMRTLVCVYIVLHQCPATHMHCFRVASWLVMSQMCCSLMSHPSHWG